MKNSIFFIAILFATTCFAKENINVVAHRGYWKAEGSAQNSITSIKEAAKVKGIYGTEFDVHFTSDNVPVVYHDDNADGINIQTATYEQLKSVRLPNGEKIPTLYEYLDEISKHSALKLIFELKAHATPHRNRECAAKSVEIINKYNLQDRTEYISFDLDACKEFIKISPNSPIAYLNGELSPKELKDLGFSGLDYNYKKLLSNNNWIKEAKDLGLTINVWTVNDSDKIQNVIDWGVNYITTDNPELAIENVLIKTR